MKTEWIITIAGAIIGTLAGWLYWKYVGCASGACVITSKPLNSTLYGALLGALLFNTVAPSITQRNNQTKTEKHDNND